MEIDFFLCKIRFITHIIINNIRSNEHQKADRKGGGEGVFLLGLSWNVSRLAPQNLLSMSVTYIVWVLKLFSILGGPVWDVISKIGYLLANTSATSPKSHDIFTKCVIIGLELYEKNLFLPQDIFYNNLHLVSSGNVWTFGTLCPPCHVLAYNCSNTRTSALKKLNFSQGHHQLSRAISH